MESNGASPGEKDKLDPEAAFGDNELDDSKVKFINGGKNLEDSAVVEVSSAGDLSVTFTGLGKEELKKYANDPFWVRLRWILFILFWVGWLAMLVAAIVIIVVAPRCPSRPDLKWYHTDAAYNVYAKSFFDGAKDKDGKQDGIGDLSGVIQKQNYIGGLGANTIWLSSIFKTDGTDGGVLDHKALDEQFGTIEDFRVFMKSMLKKGVRVIVDLVPGTTSKDHDWFQKSRRNESGYEDYYVWAEKQNNWQDARGNSMWTLDPERNQYYLHQGSEDTPDLNLRSEHVLKELKEIMHHWVAIGVSGFHIMGAEYLTENATFKDDDAEMSQTRNFPDNADVIDYLRQVVDGMDNKPGREKLLTTTITAADPETLKMYYGQDSKRGAHVISVVLDHLESSKTAEQIRDMLEPYNNISTKHWLGWRLGSPYVSRIATRMGRDNLTIAHALQALLPGTAQPYYGDEIGMTNGPRNDNDKYRTPMQWTKEANAGFSEEAPWTPIGSDYKDVNVASMTAQLSKDTMVSSFKALFELRKKESIQFGKTMVCTSGDLLLISRRAEGFPSFLIIINLSAKTTAHNFQGEECTGGREGAEVVFHSHNPHHNTTPLELSKAISVGAGEVIVLKFAP